MMSGHFYFLEELFCYAKLIGILVLLRSNILEQDYCSEAKGSFLLLLRRRIENENRYSNQRFTYSTENDPERIGKKDRVDHEFFSQLERDLTSPSVSSLEKIAQALNTKIGYFFEREEAKELIFVKKGFGKKVIDKGKNISCETLASGFLNIKMQPQVFTMGVGAELAGDLMRVEGEKFGMVLKGKVELLCDSERLTLEEGDSNYCVSTQEPRRAINVGETEAKLLWIVFAPP